MKFTLKSFYEKPAKLNIQIFRFIIVGGITASLDFLLLYVLVEYGKVNYLTSAAIGFIAGSLLNYYLSIYLVFEGGKFKKVTTEILVFLLFTVLGLSLNQLVMYLFVKVFSLQYLLSKIIALFVVTAFNFLTKKYIVFTK